jgi:hypothetical protein
LDGKRLLEGDIVDLWGAVIAIFIERGDLILKEVKQLRKYSTIQ